jgi:large subunit ribosomal protein L17
VYGKGTTEKKEGAKRTRRAGSRKKATETTGEAKAETAQDTASAEAQPEATEQQPS